MPDIFDVLTPTIPTTEERDAKALAELLPQLAYDFNETATGMISRFNFHMRSVWSHQFLTPAQVIAGMGDKAVSIFMKAGRLKELIKTDAPHRAHELAAVPPGWELAYHQDGTITPTYTPPAPPDPEPAPEPAPE